MNNEMFDNDPILEIFQSKTDLCDCDSEHKEAVVTQRDHGINVMGIGGNRSKTAVELVCKQCEEKVSLDERRFSPDIRAKIEELPGPDILPDNGPL
jgi:hypothetical protein